MVLEAHFHEEMINFVPNFYLVHTLCFIQFKYPPPRACLS